MTPALLILCGLATSFICAASICILILIERRRARREFLRSLRSPVVSHFARK